MGLGKSLSCLKLTSDLLDDLHDPYAAEQNIYVVYTEVTS